MKIAIVNHVHPDTPHVSALRMREFARVLARQGDRVVLFTGTLAAGDRGDDASLLGEQIAVHDWSSPLHVCCAPVIAPLHRAAREGRIASPFRQMVIGGAYMFGTGIFRDWWKGAASLNPAIARAFGPDVVYATFGNTDTWTVARDLARLAGCPWVADYKDPWNRFVPAGLRKIVARRLADMAAMTTFSANHLRDADTWFACDKHVVYSGYNNEAQVPPPGRGGDALHVCLSGSVYREDLLATLIEGLKLVASSRSVSLSYAGNDGALVGRYSNRRNSTFDLDNLGYLEASALGALQRSADVNVYVRNADSLFQQKLIELLAAGKPILSVPDESTEAIEIAGHTGGRLQTAGTPAAIAEVISGLHRSPVAAGKFNGVQAYSWLAQAKKLRRVLADAAGVSE